MAKTHGAQAQVAARNGAFCVVIEPPAGVFGPPLVCSGTRLAVGNALSGPIGAPTTIGDQTSVMRWKASAAARPANDPCSDN